MSLSARGGDGDIPSSEEADFAFHGKSGEILPELVKAILGK